ncbi:MAG: PHP domain-containing protein, partial [Clostridia bacterium]|nr:PHP domain-containing protein [Clostridia bacterium]
MLNEFLNKFKKASFNEKMKETISKFDSFSVMVDREHVSIAVKAELSCYVKPSRLFELEAEIKKSYSLNAATVYPHYNIEFDPSYMDGVIETLKHISKLDYGFFDGATYHYDRSTGVFVIKMRKNITSIIPEANGAELFIMQCVRDQFDTAIILKFEYEEIDIFEYRNDRESALAESIRELKLEIAKESPKDAPRASFVEGVEEEAYDFEKDGKYLVTVGKMTLDITNPEPIYGERRNWSFTPISQIKNDTAVCIAGKLFLVETKENYETEKITYTIYITDNSASISGKFSCSKKEAPKIKAPMYVTVAGKAEKRRVFDRNKNDWVEDDEITLAIKAISKCKVYCRQDEAEEKRVELHLHTNMSATDALSDAADIMARAHDWGMPAVAFTDHGTLQAYPIVMNAAKKYPDVKPIYGIEGYLVDDTARAVFRYEDSSATRFAEDEFIIFDIETTGLSPKTCGITQIGALKYKHGDIIGEFSTFVDCGIPIPENIVRLTGITDDMVKGAPNECEAVTEFLEFCGDRMLVAHNANFDISFIRRVADENSIPFENPYLDTVALSRYINSDLKKHTLDTLARYYNLGEFDHHKADADTEMLAKIFECMSRKLAANGIFTVNEMNAAMA